MPILTAKITAQPGSQVSARVAQVLTGLTNKILKKKPELTAVNVEAVPPSSWFVGAQSLESLGRFSFHLHIAVTQGTNTKDEKAAYIAEVFAAMREILGELHEVSYVVVEDVAADSWGFGGQTQERRYIAGKSL